jgi:hypothetical protein
MKLNGDRESHLAMLISRYNSKNVKSQFGDAIVESIRYLLFFLLKHTISTIYMLDDTEYIIMTLYSILLIAQITKMFVSLFLTYSVMLQHKSLLPSIKSSISL